MTGVKATAIAVLALVLPVEFGFGHHGTSGFYNQKTKVRMEGVAQKFLWRNPHCGLFLVARDASGKEATYVLEMGSPNTLARMGYTRLSIKPGDKVVAQVHVAFSNPLAGEAEARFVEVNGKMVATSNAEEIAVTLHRHIGCLLLAVCCVAVPVQAQSAASTMAPAAAFSPRDLSGIWSRPGGARDAPARLNAPRIIRPESNWSSEKLPFTAEGRAAFEANMPTGGPRQVKGEVSANDPRDKGNPLGLYRMIQFSSGTRAFEIGNLNGNIVQIFSVGRIWRTIYTDGRPVPETVAAGPFWYGHSAGHWEGDTLVVTTQALDDRQWLDSWGTPISLDARIEERWRRVAPDELQMTITINDPVTYTRPWTSLPEVFRRAPRTLDLEEIIYAPVDIEGYGREILMPSSNRAK